MIALSIILGLLIILLLIVFIRALSFKVKDNFVIQENEETFNVEEAIKDLQALVKCKTISNIDPKKEDDKEFKKLLSLLPSLYPEVFKKCDYKELKDRGILFTLKGKNHDKPTVLMAHYDVVEVEEELWEKPPFEGIIENDILWGRGTIDTKVTFSSILFSVNHLLKQGFIPEQDIYLAFSGGEEVSGDGALNIVNYFKEKNITPALVLDEGGAVVADVFPGVKENCGLIGIAEKGYADLIYEYKGEGGHASSPEPHTPVGVLSKACLDIENHPFKMCITEPVKQMFDVLGRHSSFAYKILFANLWLFKPVINILTKKTGGALNALVRTTVAFTGMEGSKQPNVIPANPKMISNIRINLNESVEETINELKKKINNDNITISKIYVNEPTPISEVDCDVYKKVASAVASTWKGCIVSPYLMFQGSDARHYGSISNHVYRFSAQELSEEERGYIHGNNERIRFSQIAKCAEFYIRLIKQC